MNEHLNPITRAARLGLAVTAAAMLVAGAAWHGWAADAQHSATATVTTPIGHAVAGGRDSYADVVDVVSPAVVTVHAKGRARVSPTQFQFPDDDFFSQFFGYNRGQRGQRGPRQMPEMPRPRQSALGSGVVVTPDGYILTNFHVVDGAESITVDFTDGRSLDAKVIGTDRPSDLALLKVSGANYHAIALGNSDTVRVGDVVLAVGNPLNVGQTVTMGIISAKGRSTGVGDGSYEDFLQTDAPINHGNSGGALVNTRGELVGINSQILSNSDGNIGIGFAIPVNMARHVMDDLRSKGKVTRSQLGIGVQNVTADMASSLGLKQANGVIVSSVTPGSAADRAGIRRGDIIQTLNGQPVHDMNALRNRVADLGPGTTAELVVLRDGAEKHLTAKLEELNADRSARRGESDDRNAEKGALGVSVEPLTPDLANQVGAPKDLQGLVVEDVDPEGRAADAGIRSGDVIQEVNRQPVRSVDDLRRAVRRSNDKPALLLINREGNDIFVTVRPANG
jgi:Do/DeqQ family serine protease